jgi:glycosyltransferase involved in cell wall biosynthesis
MKILVLCYEYPPVGGGGGRVAAQVAAGLVRRGHEVKVHTAGLTHLPAREVRDGVEILRAPSFRRSEDTCSVPEMGLYILTNVLPALRLAKRWKPDVVHVHFAVPSGVVALALHAVTGLPYVLTAHLGDVPGGVPEQTAGLFKLVNPFARLIWKHAARLTTVSRHVARLAQSAYGVEAQVILNGVPARPPSPVTLPTPRRILLVGRLSVQKNPLLAVRALALVKDLAWELEVIGDGPLAADLRTETSRLALTDRVIFHGWMDGAAVAGRMAASDLLLMTSLHEGLPMVAVEALQHGLAIVGSDIGGLHDVIEDGRNGFLCPLSPDAFAEKLRLLLADDTRVLAARQASLELAKSFDLEKSLDAYECTLSAAAALRSGGTLKSDQAR